MCKKRNNKAFWSCNNGCIVAGASCACVCVIYILGSSRTCCCLSHKVDVESNSMMLELVKKSFHNSWGLSYIKNPSHDENEIEDQDKMIGYC